MSSRYAHKPQGDGTHIVGKNGTDVVLPIGITHPDKPRLNVESQDSETYSIFVNILKELKIMNIYNAMITDVVIKHEDVD